MKLIIDIDEDIYKLFTGNGQGMKVVRFNFENTLKNGTPLPEGHGRLIDADVLCDYFWDNRSKLYTHKDLQIVIDRQSTIIEADKGE